MKTVLPIALFALGLASMYACSDKASDSPVVNNDAGRDGSVVKPDAPKPDEMGSSCSKAIVAELGVASDSAFTKEGQSIYFKVDVKAGDIVQISTDTAAVATASDVVDTAVSVFDESGAKLLASVDDAYPRATTDSQLYYRSPADATLCVQVTDFDSWSGTAPKLAADSSFKFLAGVISSMFDFVTLDVEPNETPATAQKGVLKPYMMPPGAFTVLGGVLKDAADVDVYKFTVPTGATGLSVAIPPTGAPLAKGTSSFGSSMARFAATVKKLDGTIVGELVPPADAEKSSDSLTVPVVAGDYFVQISRPAGSAAGANDFYATLVSFGTSNPPEVETAGGSNDTVATAEPLKVDADPMNAKLKRGFLQATLPEGDAADSFSFPVTNGDTVVIACGAGRNGSGLQSFKVDLLLDGVSKQSEVESTTADITWTEAKTASKAPVKITASGTAVLQLSAASRSTTNTGTYYLCGVYVTSP
jgi:hypothetical protein